MRAASRLRRCARSVRLEPLEDRLVMSCLPWDSSVSDPPALTPIVNSDWTEVALQAETTDRLRSAAQVRSDYGFDGTGQTVVVIDTGIAYDHEALGGGFGTGQHVVGGWDFTEENDANPYDDPPAGFHGTHVAGIIGADDATRSGVVPKVDLVALRVFNDWGTSQVDWVAAALRWTHEHRDDFRYPITAVNMSLGTAWNDSQPPAWATLEDELAVLHTDGIAVIAAAGNSFTTYGTPGLTYPAASPYVIPVASVDANGQLSSFSQRDNRILAAPGEMIVSTVPDFVLGADGVANDWTAATGTSMAAPYIAGASVLVREAMQWVGEATITPDTIYQHLMNTADLVYDSVTQANYHRVNLERAISTLMPADESGPTAASATDIGDISDTQHVSGMLTRLDDIDMFRLTATTYGKLQITASADVPVVLIGPDGQRLDSSSGNGLSFTVDAGRNYVFSVSAAGQLAKYDVAIAIQPCSAIRIDGQVVHVLGTDGDDRIELTAGNRFAIRVNDESIWLDANQAWRFEINGGAGIDQLYLRGSAGTDRVMLRPGAAEMTGSDYSVLAQGCEQITVYSNGGPNDVASFYDAPTGDQFDATPEESQMSGVGYLNRAIGFARVFAYASNDTTDMATLHDSPGNDLYIARPGSVQLRGEGFENNAIGFHHTVANASSGNNDLAQLYDSPGNDRFVAHPGSATMTGGGAVNVANGFDRVDGFASSGIFDVAELWGSDGDDLFVGRADVGYVSGAGFQNQASGFDRLYAYANGGNNNVARLYNSIGQDAFWARDDYGALYGARYYDRVTGFSQILGYTTTGNGAEAKLIGAATADRLQDWLRGSMDRAPIANDGPGHVDDIAADLLASLYDPPDQLEPSPYNVSDGEATTRVAEPASTAQPLSRQPAIDGQLGIPQNRWSQPQPVRQPTVRVRPANDPVSAGRLQTGCVPIEHPAATMVAPLPGRADSQYIESLDALFEALDDLTCQALAR